MGFHLATSTVFDFDYFLHRAGADAGPRHTVYQLAEQLGAKIHQPYQERTEFLDKFLSKIIGEPKHWALARQLIGELDQDDVIYCSDSDIGFPLAILARLRRCPPKIVVHVMAPKRPRFQLAVKLFNLSKVIQLFTVTDQEKAGFIRRLVPGAQVFVVPEQTDARFFTPGEGKMSKNRPLIASAGLEQRDYITLAQATQEKNIDVKVCAFSPNASLHQRKDLPSPVPENMEIRYFDFVELRDLYRSADIVVISLLQNHYSAGLTVLMEAIACGKPVIMTENIGLTMEFVEKGFILGTQPGDANSLAAAIDHLLANPEAAQDMADKAHDYFLKHHTSEHYVNLLCRQLEAVNTVDNLRHVSSVHIKSSQPVSSL
ncbi:MAG: glycosyltransferase family 4 protein [Cyanobacteriota bacterium]|nr:glycosyltransferase family 4 protein [Cyanobacteriota bacterium]